jgi:hypothetical protein
MELRQGASMRAIPVPFVGLGAGACGERLEAPARRSRDNACTLCSATSASLGTANISRLRLGNDAKRVAFAFVVDDVRTTI